MGNIESMKLFVVLSLASVAIGGMDYQMVQKWQKLKAMESCWGEENMKLVMVDMKKAIAKRSHEDAPELSLPPYRSAYDNKNQMGRMSHFKNMFNSMRFKRAAGDNLDLGDRLVEKLAE